MSDTETVAIRVVTSIGDIAEEDWDACAGGEDHEDDAPPPNPFVSHAFLHALETSGSAAPETGWHPHHLVVEDDDGRPSACMAAYLKTHSQGEFVFDHGWADAFERAGGRYYPKLQASVPFTPATGPRLLIRKGEDRARRRDLLVAGMTEVAKRGNLSSIHLTFLPEREWRELGDAGFLQRTDQQFHWMNEGYQSFGAFLEALASRKRKQVRKERREALANGIGIEWLTGEDITESHWDTFFQFYMDTGARKWGRPYLTRRFFSDVSAAMGERILLILAKRDGRYVAGALNFIGKDTLYGRHWGCIEDHPYLHFECCYYQAIEYAIQHGLKRVEAGAQGAHKIARGYLPVVTYSAHFITHPGLRRAVEDYLTRERRHVAMEGELLSQHSPFKCTAAGESDPR